MRVITLARKPLTGSVADNVFRHGTAGLNIDASRIWTAEKRKMWFPPRTANMIYGGGKGCNLTESFAHPGGRWPPNVILEHKPECRLRGTKKVKDIRVDTRPEGAAGRADKSQWRTRPTEATCRGYSDDDGTEVVVDWECHPDCPVAQMDKQSGECPSGEDGPTNSLHDSGGASRFFKQVKKQR